MNEFEAKLNENNNVVRLISETIQLENFIFRTDLEPQSKSNAAAR
jgi:hypothetical protein